MKEIDRIKKAFAKIERQYDLAGPVQKKRIMKKANSLQRKIDKLN